MLQVHVHERLGTLFLDSGGGDVCLWVSPAVIAQLSIRAGGAVHLDPDLAWTPDQSGPARGGGGGGDAGPGWLKGTLGSAPGPGTASPAAAVLNTSRLARGSPAEAGAFESAALRAAAWEAAAGGVARTAGSSITINAGAGSVTVQARAWVDQVTARLQRMRQRP